MSYRLSLEADKDLEDIFEYTVEQHGLDQAVKYVTDFDHIFDHLVRHPKLGRERNEIRQGLRSLTREYHIVFYRLLEDHVRIVRILHGSKDLKQSILE